MDALQETHSRLQKELQHEGEYDGKDDRACQVERRKDAQRENAAKKECPRIGWQRHLRLGIRHHSMWLRRVIVRDGCQGGTLRWRRGSNQIFPPNVSTAPPMMA